ncbi:hypothetical protein JVT61DRAFT_2842 [Boletus reticuloceps]|uniref:Uncharacterized protein n=1 Tax=Boletus reticuloceps TaxID=495285 RepID=A0A8I2YNM2_9AGAM|nr:hypothetical protein JVT61DRAFT_2842 [Boletus reticuloceps]
MGPFGCELIQKSLECCQPGQGLEFICQVSYNAVIQDALGLDVDIPADVDMILYCVKSSEKGPNDTLVATGEYKDIWAYINFD